jgi:hypothetical protein
MEALGRWDACQPTLQLLDLLLQSIMASHDERESFHQPIGRRAELFERGILPEGDVEALHFASHLFAQPVKVHVRVDGFIVAGHLAVNTVGEPGVVKGCGRTGARG